MKKYLGSKFSFDTFIEDYTGFQKGYGKVVSELKEPEEYPCILVWEHKYSENGPDYIDGEYVYLNDFDI